MAQPYKKTGLTTCGWNLTGSPAKIYVRALEMCYNPIGKDDTRGSDVWGLYRDGLYRGKKSKK